MKSRYQGFTLLELMITIGIFAIISAMAIPSFTGFVERNQLSSNVRGIVGALALTRSEAVTRREDVVFEALGGNWNSGWQVSVGGTVLRQSNEFPTGYTLVFTNGATELAFNARGILAVATSEIITIADGNGNSSTIQLPRSGSAYIR